MAAGGKFYIQYFKINLLQAVFCVPWANGMNYDNTPLREITGPCFRPGGLELTRRGLELCAFSSGARLLDVGCGPGASLALLQERGFTCIGLDISRRLLHEGPAGVARLQGDIASLPLAEASIDGILCECVLCLSESPVRAVQEWARVLRPGGRVLLSNIVGRPGVREDAETPNGGFPCAGGVPSLSCLVEMLEAQGFRVLHGEDHSGLLAQLAAQIIWRFGSLAAFADLWGESAASAPGICRFFRDNSSQIGYALVIAEKRKEK